MKERVREREEGEREGEGRGGERKGKNWRGQAPKYFGHFCTKFIISHQYYYVAHFDSVTEITVAGRIR